jgi:subtilase family serine protease
MRILSERAKKLLVAVTAGCACALAAGILTPTALAQPTPARAAIAGTHPAWANESTRVSPAPVASGTVSARGTLVDPLDSRGTSWKYTPPGLYPDYYYGSSGGGVSTAFTQPSYQAGVVPDSLATALPNGTTSSTPMRVVPDVSALADPSTGLLIGETTLQPDGTTYAFSLSRIGGTSLSCPTFAGIEADAQQAAGHVLGFANPAIYQRYGTGAFHDVTDHPFGLAHLAEVRNDYTNPYKEKGPIITQLRTLGIDGEGAAALPAVEGYDDSTGVGSPDYYIQSFWGY